MTAWPPAPAGALSRPASLAAGLRVVVDLLAEARYSEPPPSTSSNVAAARSRGRVNERMGLLVCAPGGTGRCGGRIRSARGGSGPRRVAAGGRGGRREDGAGQKRGPNPPRGAGKRVRKGPPRA